MAVGGSDQGLISETWNGTSWILFPIVTGQAVTGVSCLNANFCMSTGYDKDGTLAEKWNGTSWSIVASPTNPTSVELEPSAVSCPTVTMCVAVGTNYNDGNYTHSGLAEIWTGTDWVLYPISSPNGDTSLTGVSCSGVSTCMAVGYDGIALSELWTGTSWHMEAVPPLPSGSNGNLNDVSCISASFCNAVGYFSVVPGPPYYALSESWNGTNWTVVPTPDPIGTFYSVLQGISCTAIQVCSTVGSWYGGNASRSTTPTETLVESTAGEVLGGEIVGMATDDQTGGYQIVSNDGGIDIHNAPYFGAAGGTVVNLPVVGMAETPDAQGYWEVASDGGIFTFGDASFYGSTGGIHLNRPIVGIASTPGDKGYWLVASDGGIFSFGDASFYGSTGAIHLNRPIVGMASSPDGKGYWLVASDGGIFSFGDAQFDGSTGAIHLNQPIVGMDTTSDGHGYWLVAADGGIFTFGDAQFHGSD
jgi:hypothetical protein